MAKKIKQTERKPHPIDVHVGKKLRTRRTLLNVSQEKLAEAVDLTFQQIQKYERGTNRVSASRLFQFSQILDVSIDYFYRGFDQDKKAVSKQSALTPGLADNDQEAFISEDIFNKKETIQLLKAYYSLNDDKKRAELLKLIKSMAENMKSS